ncbi:MAG: cytochrome c [Candidatus Acidiferrum sp.]
MNRYTIFAECGTLALLLGVAFGVAASSARAQSEGAALFKTKCAVCHGADGKGDTGVGRADKIRDLGSAEVQKQSDEELAGIISNGKSKMPAYSKSLKPEQIKDLVAFIRTLKK